MSERKHRSRAVELAQTPEARELVKKRAELAALETELAQRELDLATLAASLQAFESRYMRLVGVRYAELDELRAQIAEARARSNPDDPTLREKAARARAIAAETAGTLESARKQHRAERFVPDDNLRGLFREVAKRIHPDLATDESERERRHQLMADANRAYASGDEARLRAILDEWHSSPESVEGEGVGPELIRVIRKIHQVERRLSEIAANVAELIASDLYQLKQKSDAAEEQGEGDLLAQMAEQLKSEIAALRERSKAKSDRS